MNGISSSVPKNYDNDDDLIIHTEDGIIGGGDNGGKKEILQNYDTQDSDSSSDDIGSQDSDDFLRKKKQGNVFGNGSIDGVNLTFSDLTYTVPLKKKNKETGEKEFTILHGISGSFVPGKMKALMGPSGSGKSTLLDLLAGRKNIGNSQGSVLVNGNKPSSKERKLLIGYVEQKETLVSELTVEQMLRYTAELKLPSSASPEERNDRVEEVIDMLDLHTCRSTIIGNELNRGISGGQIKRVNIGLTLITRPKILFLDEPTSGLDSRTANEVIDLLKDLAHTQNRTIVCTIHSPTGHAFAQFDDLHMLHAGKTIYDGPLNEVKPYFEEQGYVVDKDCSLPEWLVDLTSDMPTQLSSRHLVHGADTETGTSSSLRPKNNFAKLYEKSSIKSITDNRRESLTASSSKRFSSSSSNVISERANDSKPPSELHKYYVLLKYRMAAHYKDSTFLGTRFGDKIMFSLLTLSLYFGIGSKLNAQSIISTANVLYFISAICGYGAAAFVPSIVLERALYYRELADGCYKPLTYYAFKFTEEAILATITSLLFCVIVFYGCSLQGNFIIFAVTYYLTTMMGIVLAYAVAALVPSMEAANAILPVLVTIWMYFGGLFIVFDEIPKGWEWFSWTSFLRYSWGAIMLNQFDGQTTGEVPIYYNPEDGSSSTVLEFYGLEGPIMGSVGACLALLTVLIAFFSTVGILALTFIRHDKR